MIQFRDLLTSKKFNSEERKLLLVGIVQSLIYSKHFFPSNESLKSYVTIFGILLKEESTFKDYLFQSRTILSARVTRLLIENKDPQLEREIIKWHIEFLNLIAHDSPNRDIKNINNTLLNNFLMERDKYK